MQSLLLRRLAAKHATRTSPAGHGGAEGIPHISDVNGQHPVSQNQVNLPHLTTATLFTNYRLVEHYLVIFWQSLPGTDLAPPGIPFGEFSLAN